LNRPLFIMLAVSLGIAGFVSWFASSHPDGLERIASDLGFEQAARAPEIEVLPDYTTPGLPSLLSTSVAGIAGTIATFGLVLVIGYILVRRRHRE
jgi:cobalt/nickel transport protein